MVANLPVNGTRLIDNLQPKGRMTDSTQVEKLEVIANSYLSKVNGGQPLREKQKLKLSVFSKDIPLARVIIMKAYKDYKSGRVLVDIKEPEIEELKSRGQLKDFAYLAKKHEKFKRAGAADLDLLKMTDEIYTQQSISTEDLISLRSQIVDSITCR